MPARDRPQLGVYLSAVAQEGWKRFAEEQGVTVSALIEAIGRQLASIDEHTRLPDFLRSAVREARSISAERRERGREPDQ